MQKRLDLLKLGSDYLAREGIENCLGETEILLTHILNCHRVQLYLDNLLVQEKQVQDFHSFLNIRAKGFPLQYILGCCEFMGLRFKIAPGVFIPRPETEILVETTLNILTEKAANQENRKLRILDIGTGCGNIAISIAKFKKKADIFACDISNYALKLTRENSRINKARIFLVRSDLFSAFKKSGNFEVILSNPPYICAQEIPGLSRELHYEPNSALNGGKDGLFYYRRIIHQAAQYLQNNGMVILEIGDGQKAEVEKIIGQSGRLSLLKVVNDYHGLERVIVAQKIK